MTDEHAADLVHPTHTPSVAAHADAIERLLTERDLAEFRSRAAMSDAENRFFAEDFSRLRDTGYLAAAVPVDRGGSGLSLSQTVVAQRRLAAAAPATALGVNMHLVWVQVARFLADRGDDRLAWVLDDAAAGEVFAFGISEAGNDAVLLDASTVAVPDADGFRVTGTKVFTTLSPVWTRLGVHARVVREDSGDHGHRGVAGKPGDGPHGTAGGDGASELVFGFVRRDGSAVRESAEASLGLAEGVITHPDTWNPLGMRATQSYTTQLHGVRIAERDIAARMAPYDVSDPLILAIFSSFSVLTAAVYAGIADRALELATGAAQLEVVGLDGAHVARPDGTPEQRLDDPDTVARLTQAVLAHRVSLDALEVLARDVDERRERTDWFLALAHARNLVTDEARASVDVAMRLTGSRGFQADSELARLYRDVLAGLFHPSSSRALAQTVRRGLVG